MFCDSKSHPLIAVERMSLLDLSAFYKALDAFSHTCAAVGDEKTVGTLSRDLQDALKAAVIQDAFDESTLPFRVDVLDWHRISPSFRRVIQDKYDILSDC